jgi:hypothetical protein
MLQLFQSRLPKHQNFQKPLKCILKESEQTTFEQLINVADTYVFYVVCIMISNCIPFNNKCIRYEFQRQIANLNDLKLDEFTAQFLSTMKFFYN